MLCGSRRLTDSSLPYVCVRYLCVCTVCCVVADGSLTVHYRTSCPLPLCVYCVWCGSRRLTDSSLPHVCVRYLCVCTVCCVVADGSLTAHYITARLCPLPLCVYCVLCGSRRLTDSSLPYVCVRYLCVCTVCGVVADGSLTVHYRTSYLCVRYLCVCTVCVLCVVW